MDQTSDHKRWNSQEENEGQTLWRKGIISEVLSQHQQHHCKWVCDETVSKIIMTKYKTHLDIKCMFPPSASGPFDNNTITKTARGWDQCHSITYNTTKPRDQEFLFDSLLMHSKPHKYWLNPAQFTVFQDHISLQTSHSLYITYGSLIEISLSKTLFDFRVKIWGLKGYDTEHKHNWMQTACFRN